MSRPPSRATSSVSLFPFLAVLVCAMGALILLLLVTTRRIRSEAIARAQEKTAAQSITTVTPGFSQAGPGAFPATLPADDDPDAGLRQRIEHLLAEQDRRRQALQQQHDEIALAEEELHQRERELATLKRQLQDALAEERENGQLQRLLVEQRDALEQRIAASRGHVKELKQAAAAAESKYAIVPFDGGRGTARRPVFIECTDRGLRFLPEDLLLTENDLRGFTIEYNPLLAGSDALVNYWTEHDRRVEGERAKEPYVLLIVRPSGSVSYYAARQLLRKLDQPSGYELVPEDWLLDLPAADPLAVRTLKSAVAESFAQREAVLKAVLGGTARHRQGSLGPEGGGFYEEDLDAVLRGDHRSRFSSTEPPARGGQPGERRSTNAEFDHTAERSLPDIPNGAIDGQPDVASRSQTSPDEQSHDASHPGSPQRTAHVSSARQSADRQQAAHPPELPIPDSKHPSAEQSEASQQQQPLREPPQFDRSSSETPRERWARGRQTGIGFERDILVRVEADRLIVGRDQIIPLDRGQSPNELVESVLRAIDRETRSWPAAPRNFHWVPTVRFLVAPGGNAHYQRLWSPLKQFGISSRAEFVEDVGR